MKRRSVLNKQSTKKKIKRDFFAFFNVMYRVGSGFLKMFFFLIIVAIVSFSFVFVYHYLLRSPYIKLEEVEIQGVEEGIKKELIRLSDLNSGLSLLALNLNELKQKMEKHPWVRSVKLERRFPHTLAVQVEKEVPSALLMMDKACYVNRWGEVFKEVSEGEDTDFPVITGISGGGTELLNQLNRSANIIRALEQEKGLWSLAELSEIHLKKDGSISLYFNHLEAEIKVMDGDLAKKMSGLKKVAKHLRGIGRIHQVTGIDLSHMDGAVVSFRKG